MPSFRCPSLYSKKRIQPHTVSLCLTVQQIIILSLSLSFSFYHFYLIYLSLRYLSPLSLSNESLLTLLLHLYSLNLSLDVSHICLFINKLYSSLSLLYTHCLIKQSPSLPLSLFLSLIQNCPAPSSLRDTFNDSPKLN